jgi:uncharacterized membrane protein YhaH (DUF805 family)
MTWERTLKPWIIMSNHRIGRLQCIAYGFGIFLVALPVLVAAVILFTTGHRYLGLVILIVATIVVSILDAMLAIRRLHDMNRSGWWAIIQALTVLIEFRDVSNIHPTGLLLVVLLVAYGILMIYALALTLIPGSEGDNRFGSPPPANSAWVLSGAIGGVLTPIIVFTVAVLFAVQNEARMRAALPDNSHPAVVSVHEIPSIVAKLDNTHTDGNYAVFLFIPTEAAGDENASVNLQWSIDNGGHLGLDWILLAPRNIADAEKIRAFASREGYQLTEHEMNDVHYLRVEGPGVTNLGMDIIEKLYGLPPYAEIGFLAHGIK